MISVQEMMTKNPISLSRHNNLSDARKLMEEKRFRHIPIVDNDNQLVGLVTQRNVLANSVSQREIIDLEELNRIESATLLSDIMTRELTTVTPELKIGGAAQLIFQKKFGCLPVVDQNNCLLGIITDHDFVAITIQLLDVIEATEPLEIENISD